MRTYFLFLLLHLNGLLLHSSTVYAAAPCELFIQELVPALRRISGPGQVLVNIATHRAGESAEADSLTEADVIAKVVKAVDGGERKNSHIIILRPRDQEEGPDSTTRQNQVVLRLDKGPSGLKGLEEMRTDFVREAELLRILHYENPSRFVRVIASHPVSSIETPPSGIESEGALFNHLQTIGDPGENSSVARWHLLEYSEGGSWDAQLNSLPEVTLESVGTIPITKTRLLQTLQTAVQVAEALTIIHRLGIIHRDLSPGNILLDGFDRQNTSDNNARLCDFTLFTTPSTPQNTEVTSGTPPYMPCEGFFEPHISFNYDLFGLGMILHRALTRMNPKGVFASLDAHGPINGKKIVEQRMQALRQVQIVDDAPVSTSMTLTDLPPELIALIQDAIQPHPGDRIKTAEEMLQRLKAIDQALRN